MHTYLPWLGKSDTNCWKEFKQKQICLKFVVCELQYINVIHFAFCFSFLRDNRVCPFVNKRIAYTILNISEGRL